MSRAESYFNGHKFVNNLGSECIFKFENGLITGTYTTAVSANGGGQIPNKEIHGSYTEVEDGVLLNFNIQWGQSQTVWCGKLYFDQDEFRMNWLLNRNKPLNQEWEATSVGQDKFHRAE